MNGHGIILRGKYAMKFKNKVVVVTGGSTGIGAATVKHFIKEGAKVYVLDTQPLSYQLANANFIPCDVSDYPSIQRVIAQIFQMEYQIDHVVANAGIHLFARLEETSIEDMQRVIHVNLLGTLYTLHEVLPIMQKQQSGTIVLLGSDQSFIGKSSSTVYGCTKGAIAQMTKSLALDNAIYNIRINCVCPGTTDTPLYRRVVEIFAEKTATSQAIIHDSIQKEQLLQRIAMPEEIANVILFLSSQESSFVTGSLYPVDGGYTAV